MASNKPTGEGSGPGEDDRERELRSLQERIDRARAPQEKGSQGAGELARGLALVSSLGISLAGSLAGGLWVGRALAARTGHVWWVEVGLFVGLFSGFGLAAGLLRPFLRPR